MSNPSYVRNIADRKKHNEPLSQNLIEVPDVMIWYNMYTVYASGTTSSVSDTLNPSVSMFKMQMKVNQCGRNLYQSGRRKRRRKGRSPQKVIGHIHHSSRSNMSLFKHH